MTTSLPTTALLLLPLMGMLALGLIPLGVHLGFRAPRVHAKGSPADLGLAFEAVRIPTLRDRHLAAWRLPAAGATETLVIVHGWGSNAEQMLPLAQPLHRAGVDVLLFDARNHGASDGDSFSSLPRFAEDLGAAIHWLKGRHPERSARVLVLGHSVGAGAALFEATRNPRIDAVISIGAFADPAQLTERYLARLRLPGFIVALTKRYVEWVIGHRFATIAPVNSIRRVPCPVLLVHGDRDLTVPIEDARRIKAAAAPARVQLLEVPGAGHDSVEQIEAHAARLVDFLHATRHAAPAAASAVGG
jgi:pimeloyl-ACP methyl ester carboxylesterase